MFDYKFHSFGNKHLVAAKTLEYNIKEERAMYKEGFAYCTTCRKNVSASLLKCPVCTQFVRRRPLCKKRLELPRY